jgi:hypothetical protein
MFHLSGGNEAFTRPRHAASMRALLAMALLLLGGCAAPIGEDGLPVSLGQAVCEAIPGHRCCRKPPPPPPPQPYCTRSLGVADCWTDPARLPVPQRDIADTPPLAPGCP